ncbi:AIPR family protein [Xanthomonas oryzae]|uniref:AIPR family protein n=1 Tax=Xanthomonas oryzae TaxID=347 RepID=UPI0006C06A89|nr:AIPR family protein [Xanthomonas oryzae]QBG93777.1 hypothetical protein EYR26_22810 [Xanthomonas oryzae]
MNPVVSAQLGEFKRSNPNCFERDSEYFEVFSIFSVENGLLGENIDPFDAHLKGEEFGVDGIAVLVQGKLCKDTDDVASVLAVGSHHLAEFHFFQSKTSEKMDYGDLSKFIDGIYDFFTKNALLSSGQIIDLISAKDLVYSSSTKSNPRLKCFFCTTGSEVPSGAIESLISAGKKRLEELSIFDDVEIVCVGAKQIQSGYRSATNSNSAALNFPKALTLPAHESVDEAYVGYIQADQLLEIVLTAKDPDGKRSVNRAVFYDNVRDFNPDSEINKSIANDLLSGGHSSFVFKNNGVTVVAKSINRKGDVFSIDDYQIVNGCQTTNILAENAEYAPLIHVPLRLIGSKNAEFISSIIIGTNKQNEVRADQFWALLPFMKDLEEYCQSKDGDERIFIERRENQYRNVSIERARIMKPSELMKAAAAMFFFQPNRAARDHRGIRSEFAEKIFQPSHSVELYHLAAYASYRFGYLIRTSKVDRAKAIYKYYCLFSLIRKIWATPNIISASKKDQRKVLDGAYQILIDEDQFIRHINQVSDQLDGFLGDGRTREQIRDAIRSDTVFAQFKVSFT